MWLINHYLFISIGNIRYRRKKNKCNNILIILSALEGFPVSAVGKNMLVMQETQEMWV